MRRIHIVALTVGVCVVGGLSARTPGTQSEKPEGSLRPNIPRTWDDAAMATLEVPLANPIGSPKHVSADYYYKIPVRPIYRFYPLYAPGREPPGYMDWLQHQEPVIEWDDKRHRPTLETEADWIKAGEMVFESPLIYAPPLPPQVASELYRATDRPVAANGVDP